MSEDIIELAMKNNCVSQGLFQLKNGSQSRFYFNMKNLISQILRQDIRSVYQGRKAPDDDDAKGQEIKPSVAVTGEYAGEEKEDVGQSYEVNIGTLHLVFYTHQSHIFIKSISNH